MLKIGMLQGFMPPVGVGPKPTPEQLAAANVFARNFALRRGQQMAESTHVGNQLPSWEYFNSAGAKLSAPPPAEPIPPYMMAKTVPSYVKELDWDEKAQMPYFIDEQTGDLRYVDKDLFFTDRFRKKKK